MIGWVPIISLVALQPVNNPVKLKKKAPGIMHLRLHSDVYAHPSKDPEEPNKFKPMPFKVKNIEHEGMFKEYDKNREVRLF